jgi:carboxypeptidase D
LLYPGLTVFTDAVIITNTTLLAIQNMTWNGALGFQSAPSTSFIVDEPDIQWSSVFENSGMEGMNGPQGAIGIQHYERGLMWVQTFMAGHMQPEFQPRAGYKHLEWVLGRIDKL